MKENFLIPVFNSNELNHKSRSCRPDIWRHDEFQAITYLPKLELYSVSLYGSSASGHQKEGDVNHQSGSIICTFSSNDIFDPEVSFEEFYVKNGYKYDRFDIKDYMRELYDNYMNNRFIKKIMKTPGYKRNIGLELLLG